MAALNTLTGSGMFSITGRPTAPSFPDRLRGKISIDADGHIRQVPVTSCGLNDGPLAGEGKYPAYICCRLTGKDGAVFSSQGDMEFRFPYLTQDIPDRDPDAEGVNIGGRASRPVYSQCWRRHSNRV